MNSFFQLEGVLSAGWDGWTLGTLDLNIWGATMVDAEPKFEIEKVKNIWNYDKILFFECLMTDIMLFGMWNYSKIMYLECDSELTSCLDGQVKLLNCSSPSL